MKVVSKGSTTPYETAICEVHWGSNSRTSLKKMENQVRVVAG